MFMMFMANGNFSSRPLVHEASLSEAFGDSISTATSALSPLARNPQGLSWPCLWQEYLPNKKIVVLGLCFLFVFIVCSAMSVVPGRSNLSRKAMEDSFASIVFILASALLPLVCGGYVWARWRLEEQIRRRDQMNVYERGTKQWPALNQNRNVIQIQLVDLVDIGWSLEFQQQQPYQSTSY